MASSCEPRTHSASVPRARSLMGLLDQRAFADAAPAKNGGNSRLSRSHEPAQALELFSTAENSMKFARIFSL